MNERQKVNKIIHTYVDVNKNEDYTDYKGLITALIEWKTEQLALCSVSQHRKLLNALADNFNESTHTYVGQPMIEETLKAFNCG